MYVVFEVKAANAGKIDEVLKDDLVSRQSIAVRDGKALGFPEMGTLVVIEGAQAALVRAGELFKEHAQKVEGEKADAVYQAIKAQEDAAASGMGLIFG